MTQWDGRGLPPAAQARMQRFAADGVRTSLLDVNGMASVTGVGLPPVGEVMGCIVQHLGWQAFGDCGRPYGTMAGGWAAGRMVMGGRSEAFAGYPRYLEALYRGYDTAIARMVTEAKAMGADGVVGVRLTVEHLGQDNREFVALGTAVRGRGDVHPAQPFVTDLPGADVAKLLHSGWVPVSIAIGISVAVRHADYLTLQQAGNWRQNTEVTGYTELVQFARSDARDRFARRAAGAGAEGAIVSRMGLHVFEREPYEGHRDNIAEANIFGTTLARFHRGPTAPTRALTILPLRP